jgi:hypothetical protein
LLCLCWAMIGFLQQKTWMFAITQRFNSIHSVLLFYVIGRNKDCIFVFILQRLMFFKKNHRKMRLGKTIFSRFFLSCDCLLQRWRRIFQLLLLATRVDLEMNFACPFYQQPPFHLASHGL